MRCSLEPFRGIRKYKRWICYNLSINLSVNFSVIAPQFHTLQSLTANSLLVDRKNGFMSIAKNVIEATYWKWRHDKSIKINSNSRNFNNYGLSKVGPPVKFRDFLKLAQRHTFRCLWSALSPLQAFHMTTRLVKAAFAEMESNLYAWTRATPLSEETNRRSDEAHKMRPRCSAEATSTKSGTTCNMMYICFILRGFF